MRRTAALILVGIGVFLAVLALTVKTYVEPRAVRVPLDQSGQSLSQSDGQSKVLDQGSLTVREGLTFKARREVRGDVAAATTSGRSDDVAVWKTTNVLTDTEGNVINVTSETIALDRVTAAAVNCCGEELGGDQAVRHQGVMLKFPFDTRKGSYNYWDSTAARAFPMEFAAQERRNGLDVYHFVQKIPATPLREAAVPGSLVGAPPTEVVDTTVIYTNTREVWVEPTSGIIVFGREAPKQTLQDAAGTDLLTIFETSIGWTQETQDKATQDAKDAKGQLFSLRTLIPAGAGGLGLLLVVGGLVLLGSVGRQPGGRGRRVLDVDAAGHPDTVDLRGVQAPADDVR
ncbi:MAG: DUF3068 domain-containing protein [Kineosporiaceae bacterium]